MRRMAHVTVRHVVAVARKYFKLLKQFPTCYYMHVGNLRFTGRSRKGIMNGIYKKLFKKTTRIGIVNQIIIFVSGFGCSYLVSKVLSSAISKNNDEIVFWGIMAIGSIFISALLICIFSKALEGRSERDILSCKKRILEDLINRRIIIGSEGEMDAKLTGDVGIIRQYMELTYPKMMAALITIVVAIVLISIKDYRLSLIFACMGLLQLLPGIVYEKWTRKVYMNTMANEEAYTDWMLEGLKGIRTIKSYMQEKWFLDKFADKCSDMIDAGKKENQTAAVEDIISEFIKTVLTYGSYVVLGIFALKFGLSVVEIPVLIVLASTLFSGIDAIVHAWVGRARFNEAINRIGVIRDETANDYAGDSLIDVSDLGKTYDEKTIFEKVSMKINIGDRVLLRGKNGSGKTTFMRVLLGFEDPSVGTVKRKNVSIAYSFQEEPELNIPARSIVSELSENEMIDLSLFEKIMMGFNDMHILDKRPEDCSGGERKKFFLALALARKAELIILDEPTNHLDAESVEYLMDLLRKQTATLFICTHDDRLTLSWNKRFLMEGGRLNEN